MQPAQGIRFVHAAICQEVREIEAQAAAAESPESLDALDARVGWFGALVKAHTDGEEAALYPELDQKARHVGAAYLLDHRDEQALFGEIRAHIAAARAASGATRGGELVRLRRQTIALTEHLLPHVRKEDELITPLLVELFTPAEQGAHIGKMMAGFSPEMLAQALPWIVAKLGPGDRISYLSMLQRVAPAERFAVMCGWIRGGVEPAVWTTIASEVPGLS